MPNQPKRLQGEFDVLTDLFDWVGLRKNTHKIVSMECQPCHTTGRMLVAAYQRPARGTGTTYHEKQRMWFQCLECESILTHCQSQTGMGQGDQGGTPPPRGGPYLLSILTKNAVTTPVPGRGVSGWVIKLDQPPI